ncbi:MAG: YkgJ family cysteine cluster protein [Candidatus Bathyarchaeota archaeon]|nr:YkgJ family cysteine cluster protein [Candidatus Bathyarchaeota archaeon]
MTMDTPYFECEKCGKCCRNLNVKGDAGLMLFRDEIKLFPEELVQPCLGIGKRPDHSSFRILTYQLTSNICPHLKNKNCLIHEKRPSMCRGYPLRFREPEPDKYYFEMAPECTALEKIKREYGDTTQISFDPEKEPQAFLSRREESTLFWKLPSGKYKRWVFNLKTKQWKRYRR